MKRDKTDKSDEDHEQKSTESDKKPKLDSSLDLKDLGAGYEAEDRKVAKAITAYETKLLPFIEQNPSLFKKSNFIALKGYAVGLTSIDTAPTLSDR